MSDDYTSDLYRLEDVGTNALAVALAQRGVLSTTIIRQQQHGDELVLLAPDVADAVRTFQWRNGPSPVPGSLADNRWSVSVGADSDNRKTT